MKQISDKYRFMIVLTFVAIAVFLLNINHLSQLFIYSDVMLPLADSILKNGTYSDTSGMPAFYPLWGYSLVLLPGLLLGNNVAYVLVLQCLLALAGVYYFYKLFALETKVWHSILFLPFFAVMSLKVPDSIVAFLVLPYIYFLREYYNTNKVKHLIFASIAIGLAVNFRSEYIYLPIAQLIIQLIFNIREYKKHLFTNGILSLTVLLALLPWAVRYYVHNDEISFTASNGGAVMYISLGQLPNNKWNIQPFDSTSYGEASRAGYDSPYSPKADKFFKEKFKKAVADYPDEFLSKALNNFKMIFLRGVYTGEYANLFITPARRLEVNNQLLAYGGTVNQLFALRNYPLSVSLPILVEKSVQFVFMALFPFVILMSLIVVFRHRKNPIMLVILAFVLYRMFVISIIQYEYRHTSSFYLPLLGLALMLIAEWLPHKRNKTLKTK